MSQLQNIEHSKPVLYVVVPCYNEEQVLPHSIGLFLSKLNSLIATEVISSKSRILFVDDGSSDKTWEIIESTAKSEPLITGIALSRNRGHQNALLCGLCVAKDYCDVSISIDCDGQDDINAMDKMLQQYKNGSDVVYGVRSSRKTDTIFKRFTAESFYKVMQGLGVETIFNHADYRLMSRVALDGLAQFEEVNLFLRGMVPLVGFQSSTVEYERSERIAGDSHYPLGKMMHLAIDGITSLSVKPIRIIAGVGVLFGLLGVIGIIWAIVMAATGNSVAGWASLICAMFLVGGLQMLSIGIIGEYIGKIYMEAKHRPRFIIKSSIGLESPSASSSLNDASPLKDYSQN